MHEYSQFPDLTDLQVQPINRFPKFTRCKLRKLNYQKHQTNLCDLSSLPAFVAKKIREANYQFPI